ncbi:MAG: ankyrin repeat domain-containing protein, partial [Thermoguttaceae bacterium]|nr:ankyrin repeat domain-containing protein [Thermoguttaceae bacterium]
GCYPLDVAARFGDLKTVELLLEAGASPFGMYKPGEEFYFAFTPWGRAIRDGCVDAFRAMLKHCDFLHMFNSDGKTAVEECFSLHNNTNAEMIFALLDAGFDPRNYRSRTGSNTFLQTLVFFCHCQDNFKELFERVKEYGLTFDEVPSGSTHVPPLIMMLDHYAATPETVKLAFQNSRFALEEPNQ